MLTKFVFGLLAVLLSMSSLAANNNRNLDDPYENFNRHMFKLNKGIDQTLLKPAATVYKTVLPWPVTKGINNAISNLGEIPTFVNDLLQAKFYHATTDAWRFIINSTVGIFGLVDVASKIDLPKHYQDFGLTLAAWGYQDSAYLVLPILGPSTIRDGIGWSINQSYFSVYPYIEAVPIRNTLSGLNVVNARAQLLDTEKLIYQIAFDRYAFERNAYLQRRHYLIKRNKATHHPGSQVATREFISN